MPVLQGPGAVGLPLVTYNPSRRVKPSSRKLSKPRSTRDVPELNRPHSANIPHTAKRQTATKKIQKLVAAGAPQALSSRPTRSITKPRRLLEEEQKATSIAAALSPAGGPGLRGPSASGTRAATHRPQRGIPSQAMPGSPRRKMPLKAGGPCYECHRTMACTWRRGKETGMYPGKPFCNACGTNDKRYGPEYDPEEEQVAVEAEEEYKQATDSGVTRVRGRAAGSRAGQEPVREGMAAGSAGGGNGARRRAAASRGPGSNEASRGFEAGALKQQHVPAQGHGCESARNTEGQYPDSPVARTGKKRSAASVSSEAADINPGLPKVYRIRAFAGATAHAAGITQHLTTSAANSLFHKRQIAAISSERQNQGFLEGDQAILKGSHGASKEPQQLLSNEQAVMTSDVESNEAVAALMGLRGPGIGNMANGVQLGTPMMTSMGLQA